MGTKWKSSVIIMITCSILFTFGVSGLFLLADYGYHYSHKGYFDTPEFKYEQVDDFTRFLSIFEVNDLSLEEAKDKITVTQDEIEEHRYRYGNLTEQIESINQRYQVLIQNASDEGNQELVDFYVKERDALIDDIRKNFDSDEHVEAKIIKEKEAILEEYYQARETYRPYFNQLKNSFQYYFKDTNTGEVYTNLKNSADASINDLNKKNMLFIRDVSFTTGEWLYIETSGYYPIHDILKTSTITLEGRVGIPDSLPATNTFMLEYKEYQTEQVIFWIFIGINLIALVLSIIIFNRAKKSRATLMSWKSYYDKLPIDIRVILIGITAIVTLSFFMLFVNEIYFVRTTYLFLELLIGIFGFSICFTFLLLQLVFLSKTLFDWNSFKQQWKEGLVYRLSRKLKQVLIILLEKLKEAFLDQSTGTQVLLLLGGVFLLGLSTVIAFWHPLFFMIYLALLGGVGVPLILMVINRIGEFNRIVETTNQLAKGNLSHDLDIKGNTVLTTLASNINKLKYGVKQSQSEQAKSERLKTELITNVSHDLRTPLTSIITYTELLKKQEGLSEEGTAYLEIIDRKSKRLKVLIDDLFEVSKMASGNIELNKEKIDLVQLLQQALGEYDDMIQSSSLQFRVSHDDPPIIADVDGQKLWRVFDNLIGNILKYSLDHSRVYINLTSKDGKAIITFKNVSKYELNENTDELFERFKRGDKSRHTDGSGLGLAIAQSIVELHDGSLDIETDGDLFKVIVELQL